MLSKLKLIGFYLIILSITNAFACSFTFVNDSNFRVKIVQQERTLDKPEQQYEIAPGGSKFIPGYIDADMFTLHELTGEGWKQAFTVEETKCGQAGKEATLKHSDLVKAQQKMDPNNVVKFSNTAQTFKVW